MEKAEEIFKIDQIKTARAGYPQKYLSGCRVGKRYLNCNLENFRGDKSKIERWLASDKTDFFLIQGKGSGNGKTHLSVAILLFLGQNFPVLMDLPKQPDAVFINFSDLMLEIRDSFGKTGSEQGERDIIKKYSTIPYLVIDDIGAEKTSDYSVSILYLILNRRHDMMRPLIMTTNMSSNEVVTVYGSRIMSRIASGVVYQITGEDKRV